MPTLYHVTSELNRESIGAHGLDWTFMDAAPGIAGSHRPEVEGVFLCRDEWEARFFIRMNNRGPVDVWAVEGVSLDELVDNGNGFEYLPARVPVAQITLVQRSLPHVPRPGREE